MECGLLGYVAMHFKHGDGEDTLLRNVGNHLKDNMVS
jgi:hypothetical protein